MVRKKKLQWFGHVVRQDADSLVKTISECMVSDKRSRGRPDKSWLKKIEWAGVMVMDLIQSDRDREAWKIIVWWSAVIPPRPDG